MSGQRIDPTIRLLAKIDQSGGNEACWPWCGARDCDGYGILQVYARLRKAHRLMYEHTTGRNPGELLVCHRCDHPWCCNPAHLFGMPTQSVEACRLR